MNEDKFSDQIADMNRSFDYSGENRGKDIKSLGSVRERALKMDRAEGTEQKPEENKGWRKVIDRLRHRGESAKSKTTQELLDQEIADRFTDQIIRHKIQFSRDWNAIDSAKYDPQSLFDKRQSEQFQTMPEKQKTLVESKIHHEAMLRIIDLEKQLAEGISEEINEAKNLDQLYDIIGMFPDKSDLWHKNNPMLVYDRLVSRLTEISKKSNESSDTRAISTIAESLDKQFDRKKDKLLRSENR